jgi:C-terminal processing protease CtpA/Prc
LDLNGFLQILKLLIKVVLTNFYNDSLAKLNDLRIGDIIEKVNSKSINQIILDKIKYVNGSNYNTQVKEF